MSTPVYSTTLQIHQFFGMDQTGDGYSTNIQYAREMENVNISGGSFKPMREGVKVEQTLTYPIGTLAYLHRRFGQEQGTLLAAVSDGRLYTKVLDGPDEWEQHYPELVEEEGDDDETVIVERTDPFAVNDFDWVTYEISLYATYSTESTYKKNQRVSYSDKNYKALQDIDTAESWTASHWEELTGTDPVDILLISNATDGMYCLYGDTLDVVPVATPKKFGVLARYNERIWGAGIIGDPDMLVYSVPYDPFDWRQNDEIPEDGAGDIQVPTWDGDGFQALRQFGNDLLAVKRNSIWRITGTNPGEFSLQQQYGGGTVVENTFAVYGQYAYMLGEYGVVRYDGSGAYPFMQDQVRNLMRDRVKHKIDLSTFMKYDPDSVYLLGDRRLYQGELYQCIETISEPEEWTPAHWRKISGDPVRNSCAGMWNGVYCLALPLDGSDRCNAILQYDTTTRAFSLRTGITVDSFLQINERLFYTTADFPGTVFEMSDDHGPAKLVHWVSGYQDLNQKHSIKSAFIVYMMVETEVPIELALGIRTEKKLKRKFVKIKPHKLTRVHLNCQGRVFRFEIDSFTTAPFVLAGGVKIDLELDPD